MSELIGLAIMAAVLVWMSVRHEIERREWREERRAMLNRAGVFVESAESVKHEEIELPQETYSWP